MISDKNSTSNKQVYKNSFENLPKVVINYNATPILEYLKGIAYNFSLKV